jgi:carboxyl-terminal processing protease
MPEFSFQSNNFICPSFCHIILATISVTKENFLRMKQLYAICMAGLLLASCTKEPAVIPSTTTTPPPATASGTRMQLSLDSIFLYAKQVYYWNDALPSYEEFNPRKYSGVSALGSYERELFDITQFKINPATGKAYEYVATSTGTNAGYSKYSYIEDQKDKNPVAYIPNLQGSVDLEGNGSDMGLSFASIGSATSYDVRVKYVSPGSPAAAAGLKRGDIVTKFNETTVGTNYNSEINYINSAMSALSVKLTGKRKNGTAFTVTLYKSSYRSSPVYKDTILNYNGKKIGYVAYARFSNELNSEAVLNRIFAEYASAGVTDLVVDLRYNGGGYVSTAEHFANLIAPSSITGRVMFKEKFNTLMQNGGATLLKNQPLLDANGNVRYSNGKIATYADVSYKEADNTYTFQKAGSLNSIQKVVFIVSGNTASASELLINSLKPYVDVKLVGKTTYGKPVGFFPVTIENRYDVYFSMFTSINSAGQTDYFSGFTPDWAATDDITHDFGDPMEVCFAAAINYISRGTFISNSGLATLSVKGESVKANSPALEVREMTKDNSFKGMIEHRFKLKNAK